MSDLLLSPTYVPSHCSYLPSHCDWLLLCWWAIRADVVRGEDVSKLQAVGGRNH